jgi:hypothetical protein
VSGEDGIGQITAKEKEEEEEEEEEGKRRTNQDKKYISSVTISGSGIRPTCQ